MSRFEKFANLPLRLGVGIVVLNRDNEVFVAKRIDNPKNYWQMPQGGVDEGEDFYDAALRELEEETSIKNVTLIKEIETQIINKIVFSLQIESSSCKVLQIQERNKK